MFTFSAILWATLPVVRLSPRWLVHDAKCSSLTYLTPLLSPPLQDDWNWKESVLWSFSGTPSSHPGGEVQWWTKYRVSQFNISISKSHISKTGHFCSKSQSSFHRLSIIHIFAKKSEFSIKHSIEVSKYIYILKHILGHLRGSDMNSFWETFPEFCSAFCLPPPY